MRACPDSRSVSFDCHARLNRRREGQPPCANAALVAVMLGITRLVDAEQFAQVVVTDLRTVAPAQRPRESSVTSAFTCGSSGSASASLRA